MRCASTWRVAAALAGLLLVTAAASRADEALEHYLQGLQLAEEGETGRAIAELRQAREDDPSSPEIARELARLLIETRRPAEALVPAQEAVRLDPEQAEAHWLVGQAYVLLSREREAIPALRRAWELDRTGSNYLVTYLLALESQRRYEEALDLLTPERGGIEPTSPYLAMRRGVLHDRLGQPQKAIEDFLTSMRLSPRFPGPADHLLAVCWRLGPSRATAVACRRALEIVPGRTDIRRELSRILILLNRQEEAIPDLEQLLTDLPDDAAIPMQLGVIRFGQERLVEAIALFRRARQIDPELPESAEWLWRTLNRADSLQAALGVAEEMVAVSPESAIAAWCYANSLARVGEGEAALEALRRVHDLDPDNRDARLLAAILLEEANDPQGARRQLEWVLRTRPEDREILFRLAVLEEREGRIEEALKWFRRLLAVHPDDAMALNYAGYMCAVEGIALEDALRWTEQAVALGRDNAAYIDSYGWVLYRLGRFAQAVEQLERASRLSPGEAEIRIHLAKAYRADGRREEGRRVLRDLLRERPDDRQVQELLQLWDRAAPSAGNP